MRLERWYFLILFCVISLGIHVEVAFHSPPIHAAIAPVRPTEIEVALQPLPETPKPESPKKPPEQPRPYVSQPPKPSPADKALDKHLNESRNQPTDTLT